MSNHFSCLLNTWFNSKDTTQWVLGTVFKTEGSAYRKPGSFMLINGLGQQYGLLSGGCLESDIVLNSKKVMQTTETISLVYDSNDEDDLAKKIMFLLKSPDTIIYYKNKLAKYKKRFLRSWKERIDQEIKILEALVKK